MTEKLLKTTFVKRVKDENGKALKLQKCRWLKFNKEMGIFCYKHTLKEDEPFHRMNFNRRGHEPEAELIPKYSGLVRIAANKKKIC
jgi:hypothetical protein